MSAVTRVPVIASTLSAGAFTLALIASPSLRNSILRHVPLPSALTSSRLWTHIWRLLLVLFALSNWKNLPFAWHWRTLRSMIYQFWLNPHRMAPADLFKPSIVASSASLMDCDYNGHKSNSTYFADLDVARANHVAALIRTSYERTNRGDLEGLSDELLQDKSGSKYIVALGAVGCVFRKELKPLQKFEIWTRLLAWDDRWMYIVSHVVKPGSVKPTRYTMQPWRKSDRKRSEGMNGSAKTEGHEKTDMSKAVFASSIAKYVVKKGRLTVSPEIVLRRSGLLPPRPVGQNPAVGLAAGTSSGIDTGTGTPSNLGSPENIAAQVSLRLGQEVGADKTSSTSRDADDASAMSWDEVEAERRRGLEIAEHFAGLTALHGVYGHDEEVLGRFSDLLW